PFGSYSIGTRILSPAAAPATAHASDDAFLTDEVTTVAGNLLANNGSGADTGSSTVAQVNGSAGNVGHAITLASGASLTGNADGTYYVDNSGDRANETSATGGNDIVFSPVSFTLGANVERLTLTGAGNITGVGNALDNTLVGNSGNNTLSGAAGADSMTGGLGNDIYVVEQAGDVVNENAGEGSDTVQSTISYTLGANVEVLTLIGTGDINGTGNGLANSLNGNSGANTLDGGAGADLMFGGNGDDTYIVSDLGDRATEVSA